MDEDDFLPWEDFDKLHVIRRLREIVGEWWKVQLNFTDHRGYLRGVPKGKFFNPIHQVCRGIAADDKGFRGCLGTVRKTKDLKGHDKTEKGYCHAGFSTITVPITVEGKYLGSVFGDGFIAQETEKEQKTQIKKTLQNLFKSDTQLQNYVENLPVLSAKEVQYLTEMIEMVVAEILLAYSNLWNVKKEVDELKTELMSRYEFSKMVGKSHEMQKLYSLIERIKDSTAIVLIEGENGTGKELIARALHYNSKRRRGKFVALNCGAFNENLLESELFGHVKGAFTGAFKDKKSLFEIANDGTLFLDEIGDMPLAMQVKLLRVLQEGSYRPVGDTETKHTSTRVLAATNQALEEMVRNGKFREDLYYRLNVINLRVPPLRERSEDIPLLIEHFLKQFAESMNTDIKQPDKKCLHKLLSYHWPGNVRELENEIERLYVLAGEEPTLSADDLSARVGDGGGVKVVETQTGKLKDVLEQVEFEMIREGLNRTHWNKSLLAKELGMSRANLIMKVEKYGLGKKERKAG
ncbi:MAG: sigma 54-interacting transcriptional regulator [Deltaproteobacteria bacterium]|nr:sigma 54-interacting transcriptional regulator [Deltaproteobacteria bacterium]